MGYQREFLHGKGGWAWEQAAQGGRVTIPGGTETLKRHGLRDMVSWWT